VSLGTPSNPHFALCLKYKGSANEGRCWGNSCFNFISWQPRRSFTPTTGDAAALPPTDDRSPSSSQDPLLCLHVMYHNATRSVNTSLHMLLQLRVIRLSSHVLLSCRLRPFRSNPGAGTCAEITYMYAFEHTNAFQSTRRSNHGHAFQSLRLLPEKISEVIGKWVVVRSFSYDHISMDNSMSLACRSFAPVT
jgi:hypothetical protein